MWKTNGAFCIGGEEGGKPQRIAPPHVLSLHKVRGVLHKSSLSPMPASTPARPHSKFLIRARSSFSFVFFLFAFLLSCFRPIRGRVLLPAFWDKLSEACAEVEGLRRTDETIEGRVKDAEGYFKEVR